MAKRTVTLLIDDIDGTVLETGGQTIRFGLDGATYEIDLSDQNAAALRDAVEPYAQVARKTSGRRSRMADAHRPVTTRTT